jgi:hypothetical protein
MDEDFLDLIASKLDADEILDILGWTTYDLVRAIQEQITENIDDFKDAI